MRAKLVPIAVALAISYIGPCYAGLDVPVNTSQLVQSVNGQSGAVMVATVCRQIASAQAFDGSGNVSWTFANSPCTFTTTPRCHYSVNATNTNYVFAYPTTTSLTQTGISLNEQAALKLLSIALGALTVWTAPPTGTTIDITCWTTP